MSQDYEYFVGPNMEQHNYCGANFRSCGEQTLELPNIHGGLLGRAITVPARLEARRSTGEWSEHPAVFEYATGEKSRDTAILVIFKQDGQFIYVTYPRHELLETQRRELIKRAEQQGLCRGTTHNLKMAEHTNSWD